jgi:hypothetical protein
MVTILAFLVLGGGTALAAYVVSSNSQIGPGTVSGHKPPSGEHANIIAGSVNGQDVADNSLTGADITESSLTGDVQKLVYTALLGSGRRRSSRWAPTRSTGSAPARMRRSRSPRWARQEP